jgi:hypothetical protein
MRMKLKRWQVWGLMLGMLLIYGVVGGVECADFDRLAARPVNVAGAIR